MVPEHPHNKGKVIAFDKKRALKRPKKTPNGSKFSSIEEVYGKRSASVEWDAIEHILMFPSKEMKFHIKRKPYHGINYTSREKRLQGFSELKKDSQFKLWDQNRRRIAKEHLSEDYIKKLDDFHEKASSKGHNFWWTIKSNKYNIPMVLMTYDPRPPDNFSPRREIALVGLDEKVKVQSEWSEVDENVRSFHNKLNEDPALAKNPFNDIYLNGPDGKTPDKSVIKGDIYKTIDHALNHFEQVHAHFK